jgi:hypothetical protein
MRRYLACHGNDADSRKVSSFIEPIWRTTFDLTHRPSGEVAFAAMNGSKPLAPIRHEHSVTSAPYSVLTSFVEEYGYTDYHKELLAAFVIAASQSEFVKLEMGNEPCSRLLSLLRKVVRGSHFVAFLVFHFNLGTTPAEMRLGLDFNHIVSEYVYRYRR